MLNLNDITKETIIITSSASKKVLLANISKLNKLMPIKIIDEKELLNRLVYSYNDKAFYYVYNLKTYPLTIINTILDYLYYLDETKTYQNSKIEGLKNLKLDLIKNDLIIKEETFVNYLKNKDIIFYNYPFINHKLNFLITKIKEVNSNIKVIKAEKENQNHILNVFETLEEEVTYVANDIANKLHNGKDINTIKLANVDDNYYLYLRRIFNNYNIPLNLPSTTSLKDIPLTSKLLENYETLTVKENIDNLLEEYPYYGEFINLYINIFNKYSFLEKLPLELLNYELKKLKIKTSSLSNCVDCIDVLEASEDDDVYVLNCAFNSLVNVSKDEEYLLDEEKKELEIDTSIEVNNFNYALMSNTINSLNNITLSFKQKSYFETFIKSPVVSKLEVKTPLTIKDLENPLTNVSFSQKEDELTLTKLKDEGVINHKTKLLNSNYDHHYKTYDNKYKKLNPETIDRLLERKKVTIAYSNLKNYYECSFKYLLKNLLKLEEFKSSLSTSIGNIFHGVLEAINNANFDFDNEFEYQISKEEKDNNKTFSDYEKVIIYNLKDNLNEVLEFTKEFHSNSSLTNKEFERRIEFNKTKTAYGHTLNYVVKGFVDKIMYSNDYYAIIDMKTNSEKIDEKYFEYGFSLQLPFYVYLLSDDKDYCNKNLIGYYINNVMSEKGDPSVYKLKGHHVFDGESLVPILDNTAKGKKSSYVVGFNSADRFKSKEEIEALKELVKEKIDTMVDGILKADFTINPKLIDNVNHSCSYCEYAHICFKKGEDIIHYKTKKEEEGDDEDE